MSTVLAQVAICLVMNRWSIDIGNVGLIPAPTQNLLIEQWFTSSLKVAFIASESAQVRVTMFLREFILPPTAVLRTFETAA